MKPGQAKEEHKLSMGPQEAKGQMGGHLRGQGGQKAALANTLPFQSFNSQRNVRNKTGEDTRKLSLCSATVHMDYGLAHLASHDMCLPGPQILGVGEACVFCSCTSLWDDTGSCAIGGRKQFCTISVPLDMGFVVTFKAHTCAGKADRNWWMQYRQAGLCLL